MVSLRRQNSLLTVIWQQIHTLNVPGILTCGTRWSLMLLTASLMLLSSSLICSFRTLTICVWKTQMYSLSTVKQDLKVSVVFLKWVISVRLKDRRTGYPAIWNVEMKWSWQCDITEINIRKKPVFTWEKLRYSMQVGVSNFTLFNLGAIKSAQLPFSPEPSC